MQKREKRKKPSIPRISSKLCFPFSILLSLRFPFAFRSRARSLARVELAVFALPLETVNRKERSERGKGANYIESNRVERWRR